MANNTVMLTPLDVMNAVMKRENVTENVLNQPQPSVVMNGHSQVPLNAMLTVKLSAHTFAVMPQLKPEKLTESGNVLTHVSITLQTKDVVTEPALNAVEPTSSARKLESALISKDVAMLNQNPQ
jgi:hypothetical protein